MGWTEVYTTKTVKQVVLDDIQSGGRLEVIDQSFQSGVAYLAVRNKETGIVFGAVFLTRKTKYSVAYKDMDETMGPYNYSCPLRIIDKLSPTDHEYALKWREGCRTYHKTRANMKLTMKALRPGHKIGEEYTYVRRWEKGGKYPIVVSKEGCALSRISEETAYGLMIKKVSC